MSSPAPLMNLADSQAWLAAHSNQHDLLMAAGQAHDVEVVTLLIRRYGLDPHAVGRVGARSHLDQSLLDMAIDAREPAMFDWLLTFGQPPLRHSLPRHWVTRVAQRGCLVDRPRTVSRIQALLDIGPPDALPSLVAEMACIKEPDLLAQVCRAYSPTPTSASQALKQWISAYAGECREAQRHPWENWQHEDDYHSDEVSEHDHHRWRQSAVVLLRHGAQWLSADLLPLLPKFTREKCQAQYEEALLQADLTRPAARTSVPRL